MTWDFEVSGYAFNFRMFQMIVIAFNGRYRGLREHSRGFQGQYRGYEMITRRSTLLIEPGP